MGTLTGFASTSFMGTLTGFTLTSFMGTLTSFTLISFMETFTGFAQTSFMGTFTEVSLKPALWKPSRVSLKQVLWEPSPRFRSNQLYGNLHGFRSNKFYGNLHRGFAQTSFMETFTGFARTSFMGTFTEVSLKPVLWKPSRVSLEQVLWEPSPRFRSNQLYGNRNGFRSNQLYGNLHRGQEARGKKVEGLPKGVVPGARQEGVRSKVVPKDAIEESHEQSSYLVEFDPFHFAVRVSRRFIHISIQYIELDDEIRRYEEEFCWRDEEIEKHDDEIHRLEWEKFLLRPSSFIEDWYSNALSQYNDTIQGLEDEVDRLEDESLQWRDGFSHLHEAKHNGYSCIMYPGLPEQSEFQNGEVSYLPTQAFEEQVEGQILSNQSYEGLSHEFSQHAALERFAESLKESQNKSHISPLKGFGSLAPLAKWYRKLPEVVKDVVHEAGFEHFMKILPSFRANIYILYACAERWWDTTNTFQFPFGEMTMTPKDFAMITGLGFGGRTLLFRRHMGKDTKRMAALLGPAFMSIHKGDGNIRCTTLQQAYEDNQDWSDENIAYCTEPFSFVCSRGVAPCASAASTGHGRCDFSATFLAFRPDRPHPQPHKFPKGICYKEGTTGRRARFETMLSVRNTLLDLTWDVDEWNPWPTCYELYLGERVNRQFFGHIAPMIPTPPPAEMRNPKGLVNERAIARAMRGFDARQFVHPGDYDEFVGQFLMHPFSSRVPAPKENFIFAHSSMALPVSGQDDAFDIPQDIELVDLDGVLWTHTPQLLRHPEIWLPPGTGLVPRAMAQRCVDVVNAMRAYMCKFAHLMVDGYACGAVDTVIRLTRNHDHTNSRAGGSRGGGFLMTR
ncbi:hypothetical protein Vadar_025942 [Vaccinium darrowii]|uniref:Uncharacterized protein n=1 Tax=Vaccinium darrowii TaxID=229202 RepID=A0ACB7XTX0_9ERIC|nr:hypothetical protein Vadar_025942 [Vaccinium darrowii]